MRTARLIALAALLLLPFSASAAGPTVSLSPNPLQVSIGQTAPLELQVADVEGLYGFEMHATFDPAVIQIADADPNTPGVQLLPGAFLSYGISVQNLADNTAGTLGFAVAQLNPTEAKSGSGVLLTIFVTGKAAGESAITFQTDVRANSQLANRDGERIEATWANGAVRVGATIANTPANPTPLPIAPTPQIDLTAAAGQQPLPAATATPKVTQQPAATGAAATNAAPPAMAAATPAPGAVTAPTAESGPGATPAATDAGAGAAPAPAGDKANAATPAPSVGSAQDFVATTQPAAGLDAAKPVIAVTAAPADSLVAPTRVESAPQARSSNVLLMVGGGLLLLAAAGAAGIVVLRRGR